jgi:uncharacterized membrane protein (DUF2068 family)
MSNIQKETLDGQLAKSTNRTRRSLLNIYIKIFIWIFLAMGIISPLTMLSAVFTNDVTVALYGMTASNPLSLLGLLITLLYVLKGVVSYGLWWEKDWGPQLAVVDAVIGIVACLLVMFLLPHYGNNNGVSTFSFRLEFIVLFPYMIKMGNIKDLWKRLGTH